MNILPKICTFALLAAVFKYSAAAQCGNSVDLPKVLLDRRLHLIGEVHGTKQIPDFVFSYACRLSEHGEGAVLALELSPEDQGLIDAYMRSSGSASDRKMLLESKEWSGPVNDQDGRTSGSILWLMEQVRQYNATRPGRQIYVAAISGSDASMSTRVRDLATRWSAKRVIVLTGDLHSSVKKGNEFDADAEPMGYLLKDLSPISLLADYEGGTAWNCFGAGKCGVHPAMAIPSGRKPNTILLDPPKQRAGYDGTFFVGKIEASMPAIENQ